MSACAHDSYWILACNSDYSNATQFLLQLDNNDFRRIGDSPLFRLRLASCVCMSFSVSFTALRISDSGLLLQLAPFPNPFLQIRLSLFSCTQVKDLLSACHRFMTRLTCTYSIFIHLVRFHSWLDIDAKLGRS